MKKYLALLTALALLMTLCACRKPQTQTDTQPPQTGSPFGPNQTLPPAEPVTGPSAEATTGPTAGPATEPATEPTTEPPTEPATEPPTEPATEPTTEPTQPQLSLGELVAQTAAAQVDKPYLYGGAGPDSFDTSGLVYYCFASNGITAPRGTNAQAEYGMEVAKEDLRPGDVVFFWTDTPGTAQFVGLYIGGNQFISASSTKGIVRQMDITGSYYSEHYVTARRFIEE